MNPKDDYSLISFEEELTGPLPTWDHVTNTGPPRRFVSLRWRLVLPLTVIILIIVTVGTYLVSAELTRPYDEDDVSSLLQASEDIAAGMDLLSEHHHREIFRIANTGGVPENIAAQNGVALQQLIEPNAMLAELDLVVITGNSGQEVIGLQRTIVNQDTNPTIDYTVADRTNLTSLEALTSVFSGEASTASSVVHTGQGVMLLTAESILSPDQQYMGTLIVGSRLDRVLADWHADVDAHLVVFAPDGSPLHTTFPGNSGTLAAIEIDRATVAQAINTPGQIPTEAMDIDGNRYHAGYLPLVLDTTAIGAVGIYQESTAPFATEAARQLFILMVTVFSAAVIVTAYTGISYALQRLGRVQATATALASGDEYARTNMRPTDEIGELAAALDQYADHVQYRTDYLTHNLQRQRRESARLAAVLESSPDGMVILDLDGRVLMMNDPARELVGGISAWRTANFHQLTAAMTETLGPALAPGIFSIGEPVRLPHNERILQAQTAAIVAASGKRLGLLVTLRDVTVDVEREQRYETLFEALAEDVHLPIAHVAQDAALTAIEQRTPQKRDALLAFARDIARNARSMQRIITELRELSMFDPQDVERGQRPILLSDLIWQLAAQWKPIATGADIWLAIHTTSEQDYILGDERRLYWAIGNLIDNAIKYSLPGATVTLDGEVNAEGTLAHILVSDAGVGILPEDLPHVFERFFRGKPTRPDGSIITQPGTGQGLHLAQRVIEAHGGEIVIESGPGIGTQAHVWLPLTASVALELPSPNSDDATAPLPVSDNAAADANSIRVQKQGPHQPKA